MNADKLGTLLSALLVITALGAQAGTLNTPEQLDQEKLGLRVLASPEMRTEIAVVEKLYAADPLGAMPGGKATIRRGAESLAMASIQYAISEDTSRVAVAWGVNAGHRWFGLDVPRSGFGIDNPDNVYRKMAIDGAARYEIRGRVQLPGPMQETFMLYGSIPGMGPMTTEGADIQGVLSSDKMTIAPDGSFTVTIDGEPANGRADHLQSRPGITQLTVRDSLSDWAKQNVVALSVTKLSGPTAKPLSEAALTVRSVEILDKLSVYWLEYFKKFVYARPVDKVPPPFPREGGWGYAINGHFAIADDEALIFTLDPMKAGYFSVQLTDPWSVALDYADRNGSLNLTQSKPNADGTITYVIAARDPGTYNWLDSAGLANGMFAVRWQAVPPGARADKAVRDVKLVKLKDLKDNLPPETAFVTDAARKTQLADRAKSYARRLAE